MRQRVECRRILRVVGVRNYFQHGSVVSAHTGETLGEP